MYDVQLCLALTSSLSGKSHCFSYSKLLFSMVCITEQYLLVYICVTEKYGDQQ